MQQCPPVRAHAGHNASAPRFLLLSTAMARPAPQDRDSGPLATLGCGQRSTISGRTSALARFLLLSLATIAASCPPARMRRWWIVKRAGILLTIHHLHAIPLASPAGCTGSFRA